MSAHVKRLLGNRFWLAFSIALTMVVLSLVLVQPPKTGACPSQQIEYTYYTDNTYTTECGWKIITCSCGVYRSGCNTAYYTIGWSDC
jgi:hypothetical protein